MKIFFLRLFFLLLLVSLQFSLLDILFPYFATPLLLMTSIVAWVLLIGFSRALWMIIPLVIVFDTVTHGVPGTFSLYAVLIAYTTSFFSRRLLVEHSGMGMFLYGLYSGLGAFGYIYFDILVQHPGFLEGMTNLFFTFISVFSLTTSIFVVTISLPLFFVVYEGIKRFEGYVSGIAQRNFVNVK